VNLISNTIILVEQKFSATGKQSGTGKQKLATVTAVIGSTIEKLIPNANVEALINGVVAILNAIPPVTSSTKQIV
jgi:hypothetical protein